MSKFSVIAGTGINIYTIANKPVIPTFLRDSFYLNENIRKKFKLNYFILLHNCKQQEGVCLSTGQYLIDHQKATPNYMSVDYRYKIHVVATFQPQVPDKQHF